MRLACAEGNGARLAGRTSQSIARIARTAMNVVICRGFARAVLSWGIDRQWTVTERSHKYRPPGNESFCGALSSPLVIAVGAGDIFRTSNDGHGLLPLSPQPTILHAQHQQCLTRCFGRLARRSRLLANHAPHAVASFHPLHGRGTTVLAPFLCGRPPVHWAYQVPGEAESLTSLPSAGLPSALG